MATLWYIKNGNQRMGPLRAGQIKQMVADGKIVADTQLSKGKDGPFMLAGTLKGLFSNASDGDTQVEYSVKNGNEAVTESQQTLKVIPRIKHLMLSPHGEGTQNKHPLLALWSLAVSSGLLVAALLYAVAWKFAAPVWAYGTALVPIAIMLLIVSWYAYRASPTRFNGVSLLVNMAFSAMTIIAGLGSIYDMWRVDAQAKKSMNEYMNSMKK